MPRERGANRPDPATRFRRQSPQVSPNAQATTAPRTPLKLLGAAGVGLVLLWLVLRVSAAGALVHSKPGVAVALAPHSPEALLATAGRQPLDSAAGTGLGARILLEAPLAEEPFVTAARNAVQQGQTRRADLLLAEAVHLNPRSRQALILRLDRQLRQNQIGDAAVTVAVLSRLLPQAGPLLVSQLAGIATDPQVRSALARVVENDPGLRSQLLEALAREGADPEAIFALAGPLKPVTAGKAPAWQSLMLNALVSRGDVAQARAAWARLTGVTRDADAIYDADFTGRPGPPPFNWQFEASGEGFAEFNRSAPGLYIEYYGRRNAALGKQLLTLSPGSYKLAFEVQGSGAGEGGVVAWSVACVPGGQSLVSLPITGGDPAARSFSAAFTVPAGCAGQWLRLTGTEAEFPKDQRITVTKLRLTKGGAS